MMADQVLVVMEILGYLDWESLLMESKVGKLRDLCW